MSDTFRSAMFMQSDVDNCIEEASPRAERYQCPSEFWNLLASEVALKRREAEDKEQAAIAKSGGAA